MKSKPFEVPKRLVLDAWKQVKAAGGGAGIDGVTIEEYGADLSRNLYKLWNRLASGSYFPKPVKQVFIPKPNGGRRALGIPAVEDRVAQTVVKLQMEPQVEKIFHPNSYGYRPSKSAKDAVGKCRAMCFRYRWAIDLDIAKFFDSVSHELLMKAVVKHATTKWEVLYIERWLKAGIVTPTGNVELPDKGTPQGSVVSPLLANLYLHYGFDKWMEREFSHVPFERYADDIILHCASEKQARFILDRVRARMNEIGLSLSDEKTKIVCCTNKTPGSPGCASKFTFLGFDFRHRRAVKKSGEKFTSFGPAVGKKAQQRILATVRRLQPMSTMNCDIMVLADLLNPYIRGWMNYFRHFRPSSMKRVFFCLDIRILRWLGQKFRLSRNASNRLLGRIARKRPTLFAHWELWRGKTVATVRAV